MTIKRVTFPKEHFKRTPSEDFSDDGTRFMMYLFHDILPVSYCRYDFGKGPEVFISPRIDYLNDYKVIRDKLDEAGIDWKKREQFNGTELDEYFNIRDVVDLFSQITDIILEVRNAN